MGWRSLMRRKTQGPLRPRRNEGVAAGRRKLAKQEAADHRAQRRFLLERFVREATGSLRERQAALIAAVRDPEGSLHAVMRSLGVEPETFSVSHEMVRRWMAVKRLLDDLSPGGVVQKFLDGTSRKFIDAQCTGPNETQWQRR